MSRVQRGISEPSPPARVVAAGGGEGRLVAPGARRRVMGVIPRACCDATSSCPRHGRLVTRLVLRWTSQLQSWGVAGKMELWPRNQPAGQGGAFPLGQTGRPVPQGLVVSL